LLPLDFDPNGEKAEQLRALHYAMGNPSQDQNLALEMPSSTSNSQTMVNSTGEKRPIQESDGRNSQPTPLEPSRPLSVIEQSFQTLEKKLINIRTALGKAHRKADVERYTERLHILEWLRINMKTTDALSEVVCKYDPGEVTPCATRDSKTCLIQLVFDQLRREWKEAIADLQSFEDESDQASEQALRNSLATLDRFNDSLMTPAALSKILQRLVVQRSKKIGELEQQPPQPHSSSQLSSSQSMTQGSTLEDSSEDTQSLQAGTGYRKPVPTAPFSGDVNYEAGPPKAVDDFLEQFPIPKDDGKVQTFNPALNDFNLGSYGLTPAFATFKKAPDAFYPAPDEGFDVGQFLNPVWQFTSVGASEPPHIDFQNGMTNGFMSSGDQSPGPEESISSKPGVSIDRPVEEGMPNPHDATT
jgi:hypothetical protein